MATQDRPQPDGAPATRPSWLAKTVRRVTSFVFLALLAPVAAEFGVKLAEEHKLYESPTDKVRGAVNVLTAFVSDPLYQLALAFAAGLATGVWLDAITRRLDRRRGSGGGAPASVEPAYTDTRLRLRLDPSGTGSLLQEGQSNIHGWQQTFMQVGDATQNGSDKLFIRSDTLSITFETPTIHERPIIETFGHKLASYNYYSLGTRGAVFTFMDALQAGMLEIWFPPPGYYGHVAANGGESPQPRSPLSTLKEAPR